MNELDEKVYMSIPHTPRQLVAYENGGYSWTGIAEDTIVGMGGVCPTWEGAACAWMLTGCDVRKYKVFFHRSVLDCIKEAMKNLNLHRIETTILKDHLVSQRWAERLGFKQEGLMRKFDSKKNDYYLYAFVSEDN